MQKTRTLLLMLIALALFEVLHAQQSYQIRFRINGLKDTTCLLAYYFGNGTYIRDTLKVDASGRINYKCDSLPGGLYALVISDKNYFDFVVNNDHKFSLETTLKDPAHNLVIKGSPENSLFYDYVRKNEAIYGEIQELDRRAKDVKDNKDSVAVYSKKIEKLNKEMIDYKLDLLKKKPESFISLMINVMKEPEVPEVPTLPNGRKDSTFAYRYYKGHFWDDVDFTDDRILRTPVFYNKLKKYYDNVLLQTPDTIIREADAMIGKCRPNKDMFKFMVWFCTYHFETSEVMGFDRIFVHIVDTYYTTGQTTWLAKDQNDKIIKKANKLRPIQLGEIAPNLIMQDTNLNLISLHQVKAKYLILLFWDPECSHCEKEIPLLKESYEKNREKFGLEIFAVCSDTSFVKMKKAIRKKGMNWINVDGPRSVTTDYHELYDIISTPVIYLLDEHKKIIGKRLSVEQLFDYIERYSKKPWF